MDRDGVRKVFPIIVVCVLLVVTTAVLGFYSKSYLPEEISKNNVAIEYLVATSTFESTPTDHQHDQENLEETSSSTVKFQETSNGQDLNKNLDKNAQNVSSSPEVKQEVSRSPSPGKSIDFERTLDRIHETVGTVIAIAKQAPALVSSLGSILEARAEARTTSRSNIFSVVSPKSKKWRKKNTQWSTHTCQLMLIKIAQSAIKRDFFENFKAEIFE